MGNPIRVGVIGAGFIGRVHLDQFRKQPDVRLVGVTDLDRSLADKAAASYGVERVFANGNELIDSSDVDVVVVGVPNQHHKDFAVRTLKKGKDLLLEKPMALNVKEAVEIAKVRKETGSLLMIDHQMRYTWPFRQAIEQVKAGELGKIYNAKTGWWRLKGIPGWGSWFTRSDESGGGPMIDIGVHMLDIAIWLMGSPKPVEVFGSTYAEFGPKKIGTGTWGTPQWDGKYDVEDLATALIRFDNGATLSLEVSWAVHTDSDNASFVHLMGSEGGASIYGNRVKYTGQKFGRAYSVEVPQPADVPDPRSLLTTHFLDCVRERKTPLIGAESGVVNMAIIDAIYKSAKSGKSVSIDCKALGV
ncbi:MAG: Gfo/Idh/MocA family oxidoreductase [Treponemataceae bacterium]